MHCPYCGHTAPYHAENDGCTRCNCGTSWMDIATIHVGLHAELIL